MCAKGFPVEGRTKEMNVDEMWMRHGMMIGRLEPLEKKKSKDRLNNNKQKECCFSYR